ncbi:MAG: hypothetical protein ABI585_15555 [Betaproteobacteria bacterium]
MPLAALAATLALVVLAGCDRLAALAATHAQQSFEARCEGLPAGRIDVVRLPITVTRDDSKPYDELARLSEPSAANHRTVGLTRGSFGYRSTLELEGLEDPRGPRACARPQMRVQIEVSSLTVYVAREYRGDPCREPLILAHERKHVAVFERYADEATPLLAREIDARIGRGVRYGATIVGVQEALKTDLSASLDAFMERARDEIARRHARIDTRDEYERITRNCGG